MKMPKVFLFSLASFLFLPFLNGQFLTAGFLDIGKTQVSEGIYSQFSNTAIYNRSKWGTEAGYQLGLVQPQDVIFNSWFVSSHGKVRIGKMPLDLGVEYLWTAFAPDLRETNWILFSRAVLNHWQFGFGTGFRTFRLSNKAASEANESDPESRITEKWNMMYHVRYVLKLQDNKWNLSGTFTNYDHFIVQQENNPMYNLRFDYKISSPLSVYSEVWYKPAGLMVIRVTYYGMFLRLGVSWKI
jgi:hypothetical protein